MKPRVFAVNIHRRFATCKAHKILVVNIAFRSGLTSEDEAFFINVFEVWANLSYTIDKFFIKYYSFGVRVIDHIFDFFSYEAPVDRDNDNTDFCTGTTYLDKLHAVVKHDSKPIALAQTHTQ